MFLKDQIEAEKFDRQTTEQVLQQDLDKARNEIGNFVLQIFLSVWENISVRYWTMILSGPYSD